MIRNDILKKIGCSDELFDLYKNNGYLNDVDNFYNIVINNLECDMDFKYDNNDYSFYFSLLKKYLNRKNYDMCSYIFDYLYLETKDEYFKILNNIVNLNKSNTTYIVDTMDDLDDVTLNGIRKMELKLLFDLEKEDYKNVGIDLTNLKYISSDTTPYELISLLLLTFRKLQNNFKLISSHNLLGGFGKYRDVLIGLLGSGDYYRTRDMIDYYLTLDPHLFEFDIYKVLIDRIILLNERNEKFVEKEITSSISNSNYKEILTKYPISTISIDMVNSSEDVSDVIDYDVNYYKIYEKYYNSHDYVHAKSALLKFQAKMKKMKINKEVDYLISELNTYIEIDNESDENKNKYYDLMNYAYDEKTNGNYHKSTLFIKEALKYINVNNPMCFSMIGDNYFELKDYDNALENYLNADTYYVYPETYIKIIECLLRTKRYELVSLYVSKYDFYYYEENAYIYYMLSIAQLNLGLYADALNSIDKVEVINVLYNNVTVDLSMEKNIIRCLKNGFDVEVYDIQDFVDYGLNDKELEIKKDIKKIQNNKDFISIIKERYSEDYLIDDKIDYLMSVIKILNIQDRLNDVYSLTSFVEELIQDVNVSNEKKIEVIKTLSLYKANFIYI